MNEDRLRPRLLAAGSILVFVLALAPALAPWPLSGHSAALDLQRAEAWHRAVVGGDWLPRWLPDLYAGYGSPMFNYYAPLPYALGELARLLGAGPLWAPKAVLTLLFAVGATGAALLARRLFGLEAGIVAFGLWASAPYLLLDLYVRSALGEITGLALLPWPFLALLAFGFDGDRAARARALAAAAVAFALLVLAHNIVALLAAPALGFVAIALGGRRGSAARRARLAALALGLALSAFYWLPALAEKHLVYAEESLTLGNFDVERNFFPLSSLLPWRPQFVIPAHEARPARFHLGLAFWLGLAAAPWTWRILEARERRRAAVFAAALLVTLFTTTVAAAPFWRIVPLLRFVQFPFRLLGPASLAATLVAVAALAAPRARVRLLWGLALLAAAVLAARPMTGLARYGFVERATLETRPLTRAQAPAASLDPELIDPLELVVAAFDRRAALTGTAGEEYLPRGVLRKPPPILGVAAVIPPARGAPVKLLAEGRRGRRLWAEVEVSAPAALRFHQFFFPGWHAEVDGVPRPPRAERLSGVVLVDLQPGDRRVELRFGDTPVRRIAKATSLAALLALLLVRMRAGRRGPPVGGPAPGSGATDC